MNEQVTKLLDDINHPFRQEIDDLRKLILSARADITENIKWNGPNYHVNENDRISIRVNPPKHFSLILHRGSKVLPEPPQKMLQTDHKFLEWRSNDRAVATFKDSKSYTAAKASIPGIVKEWLRETL